MKLCSKCFTENEDKFSYCKNCGTPLDATENKKNPYSYENYYYTDATPTEIDGIPTEEIGLFIGSNRNKIIAKFSKMSITESKISWCWPAAILGLFFGFFGIAIWLFYRKMYKNAGLAFAIGSLVLIVTNIITYSPTITFLESFSNLLYSIKGSSDFSTFSSALEELLSNFSALPQISLANFISETASYCSIIVYGLFGMHLYRKHTISKISKYRSANKDSEYYGYGLKSIGGTSIGMAILAVIIATVIGNIISLFPILTHFIF